jgi:hypothetical protein
MGTTSNAEHTACIPNSVPVLERAWGFVRQLYI